MAAEQQRNVDEAAQARLRAWRRAHPTADLAALLEAVETEVAQVRTQYLDTVLAETKAVMAEQAPQACTACGGALVAHGTRQRDVLLPRRKQPLRLEREYLVCSSCGMSIFPPG